MKSIFYILLMPVFLLMGCAEGSRVLPSPSGRAGEVLIVINDTPWKAQAGRLLNKSFTQDVEGLAWSEPVFDVSRLPRASYNDMVRIARNIVDVDMGDRYAVAKVKFYREKYSSSQAYCNIQAPDLESLYRVILENESKILRFFYTEERKRLMTYFEKQKNVEYITKVKELMGYDMVIPTAFNQKNFSKENFIWMTGGNSEARTDLVLYTFPCADESLMTTELLVEKRDSVMELNVPGPSEGAFVRTADVLDPVLSILNMKTYKMYELRGIWETTVDFMGGPFVSYAYYDEINKEVKVLEGFVYAPHEDKRNLIRRLEAVAFSWNPTK